ncbi:MAG: polysaccharide pyruvyl transferase family protein [Novosphingobium pentaromativorans]|uniref:Polysaccharide pyruvyl transferase family protein n=1 Tax=Novosphingobium pentaromativorans TaxID=205844 RepID=A0A2W5QP94_9SPHN|nr:polysaccharide pyruvyl transferase family protein [Novosphingobium panipatense]PZQ53290.1 MAG: polysaccharide pyruvyl transferase family protein [Novosphingobium pentaromativorans]
MKTFIITGVQMRNKGSQAMFLSLSYSLKAIYGECEVIGFANKYDVPEQYTFPLMPYDDYTRFILKYRLYNVPLLVPALTRLVGIVKKNDKWHGKVSEMRKALRKADAIFDASGYTLGSGWPKQSGRILLDTIRLAKRYKKKIILMPQSFGPFNWGEADDSAFVDEVKKELTYPLKIYAREREGYDCLTSLGLNNVELSPDMVIRENLFPDANQIFAEKGDSTNEYPTRGSVGFIINKNVFRIGDPSAVFDLYAKILSKLIESGEKVYILNTSTADEDLVERVLGKVKDRQKVHMISGEYSSPELIDIIGRFKYVVASRYHSVVFAYRSGVPAVILGWARKYADLAALFQQQDYVFDIRSPNAAHILKGVEDMAANYESEAKRIKTGLEDVQASSVVLDAVNALDQQGSATTVTVHHPIASASVNGQPAAMLM